jgi:hypothetical protein
MAMADLLLKKIREENKSRRSNGAKYLFEKILLLFVEKRR